MNTKRMILSIFAVSVFFMAFFVALPKASASTTKLGGIDIDGYCQQTYNRSWIDSTLIIAYSQTGSALLLDQNNPYAWRCHVSLTTSLRIFPWTVSTTTSDKDVDLNEACRKQYSDGNAIAVLDTPYTPYTWNCYKQINPAPVIVINPGHGRVDADYSTQSPWRYTGTFLKQMPPDEQIQEDDLNIQLATMLYGTLTNTNAKIYSTRDLDPNFGNHYSGHPWTEMGTREYLKYLMPSRNDIWGYFTSTSSKPPHEAADINARALYANDLNAQILISVHNNYLDSCDQGTFIYYNDAAKTLAQNYIHPQIKSAITNQFGTWRVVDVSETQEISDPKLRHGENLDAKMPAVIIELGFLCNIHDVDLLKTTEFKEVSMNAIKDAIVQYLGLDEKKTDNALFVTQSNYPTVQVGQGFPIYFTVKNTGNTTWVPGQYWLENTRLPLGAPSRIDLTRSVVPGDTYTWSINLTAPLGAGVYQSGWMIRRANGNLFGPNMYSDVTVKPDTSNPNVIVVEQPSLGEKDYTGNENVCYTGWYKLYDETDKRYFIYTLTASQIGESKNWGIWTPSIPRNARVKVEILQPQHHAPINWPCWATSGWDTQVAVYQIHHRDGDNFVTINQQNSAGWIDIGTYNFAQGAGNYVRLPDLTGEGLGSRYVVFGAVRFTVLDTPVTTPTNTPTRTSTAPAPMPDLSIASAKIELASGNSCQYSSTQLGVSVVVKNIGTALAGSFVVDVNGVQKTIPSGLGVGQQTTLWFSGYQATGNVIKVDANNQVIESNETNNTQTVVLSVPTLPAPCTPSLTPTGSQAAATATRTSTIMPSQTPTQLPVVTSTPSLTPTKTLTPGTTSTPSPTLTKTLTPSITSTASSTPTKTLTPSVAATVSSTPTKTPTPSITPTVSVTRTKTPTLAFTSTPTATPTITLVPVPTGIWIGTNYLCGGQYYAERVQVDWDAVTHYLIITKIDGDACIGSGQRTVDGTYYNPTNSLNFSFPIKLWIKDTTGAMVPIDRTGVMVNANRLEIWGGSYVIIFTK